MHSISAATTRAEREFSDGDLLVTERRSSVLPGSVNNVLFLRSVARAAFQLLFCFWFFVIYFCNNVPNVNNILKQVRHVFVIMMQRFFM